MRLKLLKGFAEKSQIVWGIIVSLSFVISATEGVPCRSYARKIGECVPITKCPRLLTVLLSEERTVKDLRMLQKLTCITEIGDLERDPVVCCPVDEILDIFATNNETEQISDKTDSQSSYPATPAPVKINSKPSKQPAKDPPPFRIPSASLDLINEKLHLMPQLTECGSTVVQERIIGGVAVAHGTYPWMARLGYRHRGTGKLEYYCGGSVINKRYILTAGHCTQGFDDNFVLAEVRLGEHDTTTDIDCNQELGNLCSLPDDFKIEKIVTHPQHNTATKQNDIAMLRLNQDISFGSFFVKPICLPFIKEYSLSTPSIEDFNKLNTTVAGWGRQMWNKTQGSTKLLEVTIPLVPHSRCQELYNKRVAITTKQLCAGGILGKDSCSGDSGGPLMGSIGIPNKFSKMFQLGIVSFGQIQCGGPLPGVYTKVSEYLPWILANIEP